MLREQHPDLADLKLRDVDGGWDNQQSAGKGCSRCFFCYTLIVCYVCGTIGLPCDPSQHAARIRPRPKGFSHMRKVISALIIAAAAMLTVCTAAPASALTGNEQLGCYVTPSHTQPYPVPKFCGNRMAASSYAAAFQVLNESGTYSYAWSVPAEYTSNVIGGCTSTTDYCILNNLIPAQQVSVSVTISQDGQSATLRATANIIYYCSYGPCRQ
ncbi:MAG: hypothetical protein ACR2IK_25500 [Chloroflexota bacterium]